MSRGLWRGMLPMRRVQIRPMAAERHDAPPHPAKAKGEHRPEAPHEPEAAEYHPVGQPPVPHSSLRRGQTLQADADEGQALQGEGVAGGGRVYYSFCKLLSKGKKMKGLQQPKGRDYNPEGL